MIYLDNAATSWPKPPEVLQTMQDFLEHAGGNPGRSGHRLSIAAGRIVYQARESLARLFHAPDPLRVIFTLNGTHAINLALRGLLRPGDRVVTSSMEHNAVMRPLRALEQQGIEIEVVPCTRKGELDLLAWEKAFLKPARLAALNHASNVSGTILPVAEAAKIAHAHQALFLVDAAQTAGTVPIDLQTMGIDLLAFTGHKGLMGPPGTGGLVIGEEVDLTALTPIICGGTGSRSEYEVQPEDLPDKYESGTPNGVGIAGLDAGVRWVLEREVEAIRAHEVKLTQALIEGLLTIPGVEVHGPQEAQKQTATVSITVKDRYVSEIGFKLDEQHQVFCRVGLHCAPAAHRTLGTFPQGTVRLAAGYFTSLKDIQTAVEAVYEVVKG